MLFNKRFTVVLALFVLFGGIFAMSLFLTGKTASAAPAQFSTEAQDDANEGPDVPITGSALEKASAAALDYLGEGRVTETEVGDEEGYYEVEVTLANGSQVDVHLDENFNILGQESDGFGADD